MQTTLSITDSPSLFIRMIDGNVDIHLEYFYEDRCNHECVITVYKNDEKINNYGTLKEMIDFINTTKELRSK